MNRDVTFGLAGLFVGPIALCMTRELLAIVRRDAHAATASETPHETIAT
jgi:hypothetical protein